VKPALSISLPPPSLSCARADAESGSRCLPGPLSSSGAQGEVFKAVWKRMIPVAIKENKTGQWAGDLTAEMQLFLDLHHPHVVACYGILKERGADGQIVNSIVTEKCSTSLKDFLEDNDNWTCFRGSVDQINLQKSTILLHVSQGLSKLHDMNVLHRDIKCGPNSGNLFTLRSVSDTAFSVNERPLN
jgi:serine/threonine protein kinase